MAKRFGKYLLHECVAQGGITEIWMATDEFENVVAVRKLRGRSLQLQRAQDVQDRPQGAPQTFAAPQHHPLHQSRQGRRHALHGVEYIQGADLKALMSREHDMIDNVADVLVQMADGLEHLHDRGWMHLITNRKTSWSHSTAT